MNKKTFKLSVVVAIVFSILLLSSIQVSAAGGEDGMIHVTGSNAYIVGGYGDNFVYDGVGYQKTSGFVSIDVNDETNTGLLVATWEATDYYGYNGTFVAIMNRFSGPMEWMDGGIATNLTVHGASGRGPPVLPEVYTYVGGWGTADVYVNGELVLEDLDAHFMTTEGTRDPVTREVYNAEKTGLFSPMNPADGATFPDRILTHVVLHSLEEDTNNFPEFTVFMHINYENTGTFDIGLEKRLEEQLTSLQGALADMENKITELESESSVLLSKTKSLACGAVAIGIIAIVVALVALALRRRKS